ncbi:MAG: hypothetical protein WAN04_07025, partial [Candidatus Udaeobacter sp.]
MVVPRIRISVESAVLSGKENAFAFCAEDSARYSPQFTEAVCDLDYRENDLPDFRAVGQVDHSWVHG